MKTKHLFFGLLAGIALAGCSSDESITDSSNAIISDGEARYMAVNILAASDVNGTRSSFESTTTESNYEEGSTIENTVSSVRFYFFTDDGNAALVKNTGSGYVSYLDWTPTATTDKNMPNVEKKLAATLIIETPKGDRIPTKMLTLVNLTSDELKNIPSNPSLDNIREYTSLLNTQAQVGDYAAMANGTKNNITGTTETAPRFVMATSVYASNNERVSTTSISSDYLKTSSSDATSNPVQVYVERNVAKVRMNLSDKFETVTNVDNTTSKRIAIVYDPSDNSKQMMIDKDLDGTDDTGVYFEVTGWNLVRETDYAYLSKHINPKWNFTGGFDSWNDVTNKRCYWAENIIYNTPSNADYSGGEKSGIKYNDISRKFVTDESAKTVNYVYTNENAATNTQGQQRTNPTEVIVAGKIVDKEGNVIEMAKYRGQEMYGQANLIKAMMPYANLYTRTAEEVTTGSTTETKYTYTQIADVTDLDLTLVENNDTHYKVQLILKEDTYKDYNSNPTFYTKNSDETFTQVATKDAANKILLDGAGTGQIYTGGSTYYWFKVKHLASKDQGDYGVVRNHVYDFTLNKVVGMGTPVFNPNSDTEIIPETPVDKNTYIAAQINILSWRLTTYNVTLE